MKLILVKDFMLSRRQDKNHFYCPQVVIKNRQELIAILNRWMRNQKVLLALEYFSLNQQMEYLDFEPHMEKWQIADAIINKYSFDKIGPMIVCQYLMQTSENNVDDVIKITRHENLSAPKEVIPFEQFDNWYDFNEPNKFNQYYGKFDSEISNSQENTIIDPKDQRIKELETELKTLKNAISYESY